MPYFIPLKCQFCQTIVRGIMFKCTNPRCNENNKYACESCYREGKHPQSHTVKYYKHCCLHQAILPPIADSICKCPNVRSRREPVDLFPVDEPTDHLANCGLLRFEQLIAIAKAESVLPWQRRRNLPRQLAGEIATTDFSKSSLKTDKSSRGPTSATSLDTISGPLRAKEMQNAMANSRIVHRRDPYTPLMMRCVTDRLTFGNTHMALTFGPLIIENGVPK
jgi:hypothetical protein